MTLTNVTEGVHNQLIVSSVQSYGFVAITAFLGNTLILVALHKKTSLHAPSKLLFRNLATTDLCVGIIAKPLFITYLISTLKERWNFCRYSFVIFNNAGHILGGVSLFTLTAISADRLLALLLGFRYRQVVTLKRTDRIVAIFGVFSTAGATTLFFNQPIALRYVCVVVALRVVTSITRFKFCRLHILSTSKFTLIKDIQAKLFN